MKRLLILCLAVAGSTPVHADDSLDKLRAAIDKGISATAVLSKLKPKDVPKEFRSELETLQREKYTVQRYSRGGERRLEVSWNTEWTGAREKYFMAVLYHGKTALMLVGHLGDSSSFTQPTAPGYELHTNIKDSGEVTLLVENEELGFMEAVELNGRQTHLADDLEYTKAILVQERFLNPLQDALKEAIGATPGQSKKKPARK